MGYVNQFAIKTLDSQYRAIDYDKNDDFTVTTLYENDLTGVSVTMTNSTNGATSDYVVSVTPMTSVFTGDVFTIRFPPEIIIPSILECSRHEDSYILEITCTRAVN